MSREDRFKKARARLIEILRGEGIKDERVLNAINSVPRHLFMDEHLWPHAYDNIPLPIGAGQTISQPYIVACMTEAIIAGRDLEAVLEIGTGSGYQAAVLSHVVKNVYTVERIESLAHEAQKKLTDLGYSNVHCRYADGYHGWVELAPFLGILVTAAPSDIPQELLEQLAEGGRMVIPIGRLGLQELVLIVRHQDEYKMSDLGGVRFVPLVPGIE